MLRYRDVNFQWRRTLYGGSDRSSAHGLEHRLDPTDAARAMSYDSIIVGIAGGAAAAAADAVAAAALSAGDDCSWQVFRTPVYRLKFARLRRPANNVI
jgi:hypothetical protein